MQAIEPTSEAINKAFPDYHPQWVQLSQLIRISPEMFTAYREMLHMDKEQCAAYLRVSVRNLRRWEAGAVPVPFAAIELLRVVYSSVHFKLSHPEWDGWFIGSHGELNSPDIGGKGFTPPQLVWSTMTRNEAAVLRNDVARLQSELEESITENTRLRQLFVAQGLVDELASMQDTINDLMARIATAKVIPFPTADVQPLEKTA